MFGLKQERAWKQSARRGIDFSGGLFWSEDAEALGWLHLLSLTLNPDGKAVGLGKVIGLIQKNHVSLKEITRPASCFVWRAQSM